MRRIVLVMLSGLESVVRRVRSEDELTGRVGDEVA
jgi:hypothetical protein